MVSNIEERPHNLLPEQQKTESSNSLKKAEVQETWWRAWWTIFYGDCTFCDSKWDDFNKLHPRIDFWVDVLIVVCLIGIAYSAYCLARVSPSIIYNLYTFVKYIFSYFLKDGDKYSNVNGGLAKQFAPVVQYARASQLEYLDQQAAQWIKETREHIMVVLTTNLAQVWLLYYFTDTFLAKKS